MRRPPLNPELQPGAKPGPSARKAAPAACALIALIALEPEALARFDPGKVYREAPPVAAKFPDPAIEIATPAFAPGKQDFTGQEELLAFVDMLAKKSADLRVRVQEREHRRGVVVAGERLPHGSELMTPLRDHAELPSRSSSRCARRESRRWRSREPAGKQAP